MTSYLVVSDALRSSANAPVQMLLCFYSVYLAANAELTYRRVRGLP